MHTNPGAGRGRRHDSEATRAALLDAARELFGRFAYEQVTLRDIGRQAGVDGSLVARYFGSKGALHRAAVDEDSRRVAPEPMTDLASFAAEALRRVDRRKAPGPLVRTLLAPGAEEAARIAAAQDVRTQMIAPLISSLTENGSPDPQIQAETLVACLLGIIALRPSNLFPTLSTAPPEQIALLLKQFADCTAIEPPVT